MFGIYHSPGHLPALNFQLPNKIMEYGPVVPAIFLFTCGNLTVINAREMVGRFSKGGGRNCLVSAVRLVAVMV